MQHAIVAIDSAGRIVLFSRGAASVFGYTEDEMLGAPLGHLLPEDARAAHEGHVAAFRASPQSLRAMSGRPEIRGRRKDGSLFPAQAMLWRGTISGNDYMVAVVHDLTDFEALRRSLDLADPAHGPLTTQSPVGLVLADPDGVWRAVNPTAAVLLGYAEGNLAGRSFSAITAPEDIDGDRRMLERLRRGEIRSYRREKTYLRNDGTPLWATVTVTAVGDGNDGARDLLIVVEDLASSRTRELGRIIDRSTHEVYLFEAGSLLCVYANDGACANIGYSRSDLGALTPLDLMPDMSAGMFAALVAPLRRGTRPEVSFETVHRRRDGTRYDVRVRLQMLPYFGRASFVAMAEDITELRQVQERLLRAQKMEAVGQLSGGLAHDFNNLLQVILGNTEDLQELTAADPAAREAVAQVQHATVRAADLVSGLLTFARARDIRPHAVDLGEVLHSMQAMLGRTLGTGSTLAIQAPAIPLAVRADRTLLESALLNLVINARHAMPDGGTVTISADLPPAGDARAAAVDLPGGEYATLRFADTGVGMTSEVAAKAFDPFFTTRDVGEGSGLGLSMVYGFARQSGGDVQIESGPGRGTVVTLFLPLAGPEARDVEPAPGREPPEGRTVLLVEDDRAARRQLARQIRSLGHRVIEARDARAALVRLARLPRIDLLLGGLASPETNVVDLAARARRLRPGLKLLLASDRARRHAATRYAAARPSGILALPCRRTDIRRAFRRSFPRA